MTIQGVSKKLASWKIASIFKLVLSLILISSHIYNLGMLASTETKIMNTSASSSPVLRGKWAILEFDLSA